MLSYCKIHEVQYLDANLKSCPFCDINERMDSREDEQKVKTSYYDGTNWKPFWNSLVDADSGWIEEMCKHISGYLDEAEWGVDAEQDA